MAPIPIYSQSPISAAKASGVTPKTDAVAQNDSRAAPEMSTKTRPLGAGAVPPPPQPGAFPNLPQPTGAVQSHGYHSYTPPPPVITTAATTTKTAGYSPPPPQPGAVPVPPGGATGGRPQTSGASMYYQRPPPPATTTAAVVLTPPPRDGETLASTGILDAPPPATTAMPPQMAMPPLTTLPYTAARGTATDTQGNYPGIPQPTGLAQGLAMGEQQQSSLDHPPGYVQDAYAADMNSSQRAAAHLSNSGLSSYHSNSNNNFNNNNNNNNYNNNNYNNSSTYGGEDDSEGIWDAAKKLAWSAGERLSAAETEVWRRINKQE